MLNKMSELQVGFDKKKYETDVLKKISHAACAFGYMPGKFVAYRSCLPM